MLQNSFQIVAPENVPVSSTMKRSKNLLKWRFIEHSKWIPKKTYSRECFYYIHWIYYVEGSNYLNQYAPRTFKFDTKNRPAWNNVLRRFQERSSGKLCTWGSYHQGTCSADLSTTIRAKKILRNCCLKSYCGDSWKYPGRLTFIYYSQPFVDNRMNNKDWF